MGGAVWHCGRRLSLQHARLRHRVCRQYGAQVLLLPDVQPSSAICTSIAIVRMVEARGKTLTDHLADPDCYLVGPDQNLCEVYAKGKKLCVEWARAKNARRSKLIRKKAQV